MEEARTKATQTSALIIAVAALLVSQSCSTEPTNTVTPQYSRGSPPPQYVWLDQFAFLDAIFETGDGKTLWAAGDRGTILHTTDGEPLPVPAEAV
jgi:hypothetical protein